MTADVENITDSAAFNVTITFNEPVTGFEQDDISVTNGVLADFSTVTARKVFKVKVTPQAAGEVTVSVAENVAVDLSNNPSTASNIITVTNTLTPAKSSEKAITAFSFSALSVNGTINNTNKTIAVTVPFGTNVGALIANFTASAKATVKVGDTVQVNGETSNDFSSAVVYKVTAEDGSTADYTVTVTVAANPAKAITAFNFATPAATGVVDEENKTVAITVPFGIAITALTPTITHSGASVSPSSGAAQDFTSPVPYTVTAADTTTQQYVVTVTIAPEPVTAVGAVSGVPMDGQILSAGAVTPGAATVDYRWQVSNDGVNGWNDIPGANAGAYTVNLVNSAIGQYVRVVATGNGSYGGEVFSAAEKIQGMPTMVSVPAGTFQRDADPANTSFVSAFSMSAHEITRAQFARVMGTDPSDTAKSSGNADPAQMVNWYHAIAFCNKLSLAESLTPAYAVSGVNFSTLTYAEIPTSSNTDWNAATCDWSANGYRLPTEMEWMWAAMGADQDSQPDAMSGGVNVTGYAKTFAGYNGSNSLNDYAWYLTNSSSKTHPAGTKLANELGLYDMSGNVWEWCWDWHGDYPAGSNSDYRGTGSHPVMRGGSWDYSAGNVTVARRNYFHTYYQVNYIGFRVVRP